MKRLVTIAAALTFFAAVPASADQFAVKIDGPYQGASQKLMDALKVSEVESFTDAGQHYVVLEAPSEAYVEAFFFAVDRKPIELHALDADWTNPTMQNLTMAQRLGFLREISCAFCTS